MYKFLLSVCLLGLLGCVTTDPYRTDLAGAGDPESLCPYASPGDCADKVLSISNKGTDSEYLIGFLEYDDQGMPHSPTAVRAVAGEARRMAESEEPLLLIVFAHGWNHDSAGGKSNDCRGGLCGEDSDIVNFRRQLLETAAASTDMRVMGVYVGWRGRALHGCLNRLTFWNRKRTAHEIGEMGVTEALLELESIVKREDRPRNRMVSIGHSFGAALMYSALRQTLSERYVQSRPYRTERLAEGFGDLVLLMNPAFEALRYSSLFELSQDECRPYPQSQLPKLVILSSGNDKAVSRAFPIPRFLDVLSERHRSGSEAYATHCPSDRTTEEERGKCTVIDGVCRYPVRQFSGDVNAVGHYKPYITHDLRMGSSADSLVSLRAAANTKALADAWVRETGRGDVSFGRTELHWRGLSLPGNPYMNIYADPERSKDVVMSGHNDIWNPAVREFIATLIQITAAAR